MKLELNKKAFTLIELLVVIGIIGILSGLIVISMDNVTNSSKDQIIKADVSNLKKVLLMYKTLSGNYPIQATQCNIGDTSAAGCANLASALAPDYLQTFPISPSGEYYTYQSSNGGSYTVFSTLSDGEYYTYSPSSGFTTGSCGDPVTFSYNGSSVTYGSVVSQAGNCWLDRNLGATQAAAAYNDSAAYGDLFQWGRLDDGHQVRTSSTTATLSTTDIPIDSSFITNTVSYYNWRTPYNTSLWQGVSGINNPCPSGFRLPTTYEWSNEINAGGWTGRASAYASPLKLTTPGYRVYTTGAISGAGSYGYYWSSTATSNERSYYYYNYSTTASTTRTYRATAYSVRCIKD
ncbi:MAG: FISUMP domain-containing protein [Candidatus Paceibacterota bacterium]|jgi:type II secretion system protein G